MRIEIDLNSCNALKIKESLQLITEKLNDIIEVEQSQIYNFMCSFEYKCIINPTHFTKPNCGTVLKFGTHYTLTKTKGGTYKIKIW